MKKLALMGLAVLLMASYMSGQTFARAIRPGPGHTTAFLTQAFAATHSRLTGFEVHDWSTLYDGFSSVATLTRNSKRLAQEMDIASAHLYTHDGPHDHVAMWTGVFAVGTQKTRMQATVEMASMSFPDAPAQTVLILRLWAKSASYRDFAAAYRTVRTTADSSGGSAVVNATLFGVLPGLLNTAQRGAVVREAYAAVRARPLQTMVYTYTTSVAGYAVSGGRSVLAGRQPVNLQVALHENSYSQSTRVLVGSPIITVEY